MLRPFLYLTLWLSILIFGAAVLMSRHRGELRDLLVMGVENKPNRLYDPRNGLNIPLPFSEIDLRTISFSSDGKIAFSVSDEIYIWNINTPILQPVPIPRAPDTIYQNPMRWSPDGQFLAFTSRNTNEGMKIQVWTMNAVNAAFIHRIEKGDMYTVEMRWSYDNQLAITVAQALGSYLSVWMGDEVINLSQSIVVNGPPIAWSRNGQLAWLENQNDEISLMIWDGEHTKAVWTTPLVGYPSYVEWFPNGTLLFKGSDPAEPLLQWDGQQVIKPDLPRTMPEWSTDGRRAYLDGDSQVLPAYVESAEGRQMITEKGGYMAWTQSNFLVMCPPLTERTHMSFWNGQHITRFAYAPNFEVVLQGGNLLQCPS